MNYLQPEILQYIYGGDCPFIYELPGESDTAAAVRMFIQSITVGNPAVTLVVVTESTNGTPMQEGGWRYRLSNNTDTTMASSAWKEIELGNIPGGTTSTNIIDYVPDSAVKTMYFKTEAIAP
jgi:hypothetical protein